MVVLRQRRSRVSRKPVHRWRKPLGITAGLVGFCTLCVALDSSVLAHNQTPDPIVEVKEVYVDPDPAASSSSAENTQLGKALASYDAETTSSSTSLQKRFSSFTVSPSFLSSQDPEAENDPSADTFSNAAPSEDSSESAASNNTTADSTASSAPASSAASESSGKDSASAANVTVSASSGGYSNMMAWKAKYPDVVGYIKIPGTNIEHPVVWNASNLYYTSRGLDKQYSYNGVIWADQDVSPSSRNTILYGHNWTNYSATPRIGNPNDVMFAQLTAYQYPSFAQSHPTIQYANANGDGTYVIFGAFYTTDLTSYIDANLSATSALALAKSQNLYNFSTDVNSSDKIITLSTCTRYFGQFENQRFVVMARKLREGETANITISEK